MLTYFPKLKKYWKTRERKRVYLIWRRTEWIYLVLSLFLPFFLSLSLCLHRTLSFSLSLARIFSDWLAWLVIHMVTHGGESSPPCCPHGSTWPIQCSLCTYPKIGYMSSFLFRFIKKKSGKNYVILKILKITKMPLVYIYIYIFYCNRIKIIKGWSFTNN